MISEYIEKAMLEINQKIDKDVRDLLNSIGIKTLKPRYIKTWLTRKNKKVNLDYSICDRIITIKTWLGDRK